jgi:hypothetical protein
MLELIVLYGARIGQRAERATLIPAGVPAGEVVTVTIEMALRGRRNM